MSRPLGRRALGDRWRRGHCRLPGDRRESLLHDLGHAGRIEPLLLQVVLDGDGRQHVLDHRHEGVQHALPARRDRLHGFAVPEVQGLLQLGIGAQVAEVLLVPLEDEGHLLGNQPVGQQVYLHVLEGLYVLLEGAALAVGHEDHGVRARQHDPPGGVVLDLAGHGVDLDLEVVAGDRSQAEGQEVEEEGPVLGRVQGDEAIGPLGVGQAVDLLEVGRLARLGRAVIDNLGLDGPFAEVELDHGLSVEGVSVRQDDNAGLYHGGGPV